MEYIHLVGDEASVHPWVAAYEENEMAAGPGSLPEAGDGPGSEDGAEGFPVLGHEEPSRPAPQKDPPHPKK